MITINYNKIIENYENKKLKEDISKYKNYINKISNKWNNCNVKFYNKLSNIKPTILKNNKEITSIYDIINNIKKIDIILPDGRIEIYYKIKNYTIIQL